MLATTTAVSVRQLLLFNAHMEEKAIQITTDIENVVGFCKILSAYCYNQASTWSLWQKQQFQCGTGTDSKPDSLCMTAYPHCRVDAAGSCPMDSGVSQCNFLANSVAAALLLGLALGTLSSDYTSQYILIATL